MRERVVVKVGTSVLTLENGDLNLGVMQNIALQILTLKGVGYDVILVSSGAVGCGMRFFNLKEYPEDLRMKQACASVGQTKMMSSWEMVFGGTAVAQVLITRAAFDGKNLIDFKGNIETLLEFGIIPIINENDAVSTAEIDEKFTDNDELAVSTAIELDAEFLFILSDEDGLYSDNPRINPNAMLYNEVRVIDENILTLANGGNSRGRGGMKNKLLAIRRAMKAGISCFLNNGEVKHCIEKAFLLKDGNGTYFPGSKK